MERDYFGLSDSINSAKSTQIALNAIRFGEAGLNVHRQNLLNRVPVTGSFASFPKDSIEIEDLAYLSAHEDHESELRKLGGLNGDAGNDQPAFAAVQVAAPQQNRNEQNE